MGRVERTLIEQSLRRRQPLPEVIANAPGVRADLYPYWDAYQELATCRPYVGMAGVPGPIPWTAIERYAGKHGFAGEAFDDLLTIVRTMDTAFLEHSAKDQGGGKPGGVQEADGRPGG